MKAVFMKFGIFGMLALGWCGSLSAESGEIVVLDAGGNARAREAVADSGTVECSLTDSNGNPAEGFEVFLVNLDTRQSLAQPVVNGKAVFDNVPPGRWQVTSAADWARFTSVVIRGAAGHAPLGAAGGSVNYGYGIPLLMLGAAAAGPAVAIGNSGDNGSPLSPSS